MKLELERNAERYRFLRWAQGAFTAVRVFPPGSGIIHQINLEHIAEVVRVDAAAGLEPASPIEWRIVRREAVKQWHTGPFPRPTLGPPSYPRG